MKIQLLLLLFAFLTYGISKAQIGQIYISHNKGESWERADKGIPHKAVVNSFTTKDDLVFSGTEAHGIYVSSDKLSSWYAAKKGLPSGVKVDALLTYKGQIIAGTNKHGIFISKDNGNSWFPSNKGLTNLTIRCLLSSGTDLLAGTNDGIFVLSAHEKSWNRVNKDLQINGFAIIDKQLVAATNRGLLIS